jgi:serine/threonine protein kinase
MALTRTCPKCGAALPGEGWEGLCPKCLVRVSLEAPAAPEESAIANPQSEIVNPKGASPESRILPERIGTIIGRYKLLQQLGEGGFGIVFMAEQQEPVQREVALKIIKAGMDTREIIARFEAERQALALMDHPNIARVLDGGATSSGRSYFVMELVRGIPITDYCDQASLSTRERLQLFIKVCRAVQHAHQKGVIHRDLKPSNVLVTLHDGEAVPKVIDFGVAKALGQKLTDKTPFTRFEQMIGTPAYMSPEQAALSGVDIDTRSDIYSLGVMLYELLTGVTLFDAETLRQAPLDQIRLMIQETEPPKPSTRVTDLVAADVRRLTTSAEKDKPTLRRLVQQKKERINAIRGDLDWITMKALEKDRNRRYETVNGLAADLERHLNHEPVLARPPSTLYRFERTVRRHRGAFAAGAAVAVALMLGVVIGTWQAVRATRAEREQRRERQRADEAADHAKRAAQEAREQLWNSYLGHTSQRIGPAPLPPAMHTPARDPHCNPKSADLSAFYNASLTNDLFNPAWVGNTLETLPAGRQTFDGIEFDIRGIVQLGGAHAHFAFYYPPEIRGVPVRQRCRSLHFLHAFGWLAPSGFQVWRICRPLR